MSRREHSSTERRVYLRGSLAALLVVSVLEAGCSGGAEVAQGSSGTANTELPISAANPVQQTTTDLETIVYGSAVGYGYSLFRYAKLKNPAPDSATYTADHAADCAAAEAATASATANPGGYRAALVGRYPGASGGDGCQKYAEYRFQMDIYDPALMYAATNAGWMDTRLNPADPTVCYRPKYKAGKLVCSGTTCGYGGVCSGYTKTYDTCTIQYEKNLKSFGYPEDLAGLVKSIYYMPPGGASYVYNAHSTTAGHALTTTDSTTDTVSGYVGFGSPGNYGVNVGFSQTAGWYTSTKRYDGTTVQSGTKFPKNDTGADQPDHMNDWMDIYVNHDLAIFYKCPTLGLGFGSSGVPTPVPYPMGVSPFTSDFTGFFVRPTAEAPWVLAGASSGAVVSENQSVVQQVRLRYLFYPVTATAKYRELYGLHDSNAITESWLFSAIPTEITVNGQPVSSSADLDGEIVFDAEGKSSYSNLIDPMDIQANNIPVTSCDGLHKVCSHDGIERFGPDVLKKLWSKDPFFDELGHQVQWPSLENYPEDAKGKRRFIPVYNNRGAKCDPTRPLEFRGCTYINTGEAPILNEWTFRAAESYDLINGVSKSYSESFDLSFPGIGGVSGKSVVSWSQESDESGLSSLESTFHLDIPVVPHANCFMGNLWIDTFTWQFIVPGVVYHCDNKP